MSSLNDFYNYVIKNFGLSENTAKTYTHAVEVFFQKVNKSPQEVAIKDVIEFFQWLYDEKYAVSTQIIYLSALRAYYDYLIQLGEVDINVPRMYKRRFRLPRKLPEIITVEEVDLMIQAPYNYRHDEDKAELESAVIATLGSTGIRVSELCDLKPNSLENNTLKVFGKGGKERRVPIITKWFSCNIIEKVEYLLNHTHELYPRKVHRIVSLYGKMVTGKRVHPHTLRHTFATQLIREGVDIVTVKNIMGHESIVTTQKYVHLAQKDIIDELQEKGLL